MIYQMTRFQRKEARSSHRRNRSMRLWTNRRNRSMRFWTNRKNRSMRFWTNRKNRSMRFWTKVMFRWKKTRSNHRRNRSMRLLTIDLYRKKPKSMRFLTTRAMRSRNQSTKSQIMRISKTILRRKSLSIRIMRSRIHHMRKMNSKTPNQASRFVSIMKIKRQIFLHKVLRTMRMMSLRKRTQSRTH